MITNQVLLKFAKGMVTGGLSAVAASLSLGVKINNLDDLRGVFIVLCVAFASGAIHALIELLNPTLPATTIQTTVTSQTVPNEKTPILPLN